MNATGTLLVSGEDDPRVNSTFTIDTHTLQAQGQAPDGTYIAGGSTFFTHYDLKVQPKKGLTLIWPSEWTHAHRGDLLKANSKYIITGWMHFPK